MNLRTIMIFPILENIEIINSIRDKYDPLANLVKPHITIVFPFESDMSNEEVTDILNKRLMGIAPFDIELKDFGKYTDASGNYLSLYLTKGVDVIKRIHDMLYGNEFKSYDIGVEYVPHITVGKLPTNEEMEAAYEEIRDIDEVFSTQVRKISVEMIGENEESIIIIEKELE